MTPKLWMISLLFLTHGHFIRKFRCENVEKMKKLEKVKLRDEASALADWVKAEPESTPTHASTHEIDASVNACVDSAQRIFYMKILTCDIHFRSIFSDDPKNLFHFHLL